MPDLQLFQVATGFLQCRFSAHLRFSDRRPMNTTPFHLAVPQNLLGLKLQRNELPRRRVFHAMLCVGLMLIGSVTAGTARVHADESKPGQEERGQEQLAPEKLNREELVRRTTAVALNYCRAALHRIRRSPTKNVFHQEQTQILNNLNLNQIDDPEVIALYKSILDEISQVEISERERVVIDEQFRRNIHRQLGTSFFVIGAQVATGQLGNVVQSGANSWWDYRNQEVRRDADQWKVEKSEFTDLMSRSSKFLDSFWKLSQKNKIPDEWLVRDQDLDQLNRILAEASPERRLRMMGRMERFMECYPPYWYYLAKTQQQMGLSKEALETYKRLTDIGTGHFRQDDMLASCMANTALLLEQNGDPAAVIAAAKVYDYSIRNWESNLICAWVLGRHQEYEDAEDLILCNLDEDREARQSRVALTSLYYHSNDRTKLAALLNDQQVVRDVPVPGLLLCAKLLDDGNLPAPAQQWLASTLSATVRRVGNGNAVTLIAGPGWKIQDSQLELASGNQVYHSVGYRPGHQGIQADFVNTVDPETEKTNPIYLTLNYPGTPKISITMLPPKPVETAPNPSPMRPFVASPFSSNRQRYARPETRYQIGEIKLEGLRLSFQDDSIIDARGANNEREISAETERVIR